MPKRARGKRGVASCSKKRKKDELHIEFDEDMLPMGSNKSKFSSWLGLKLRKKFSYHIDTSKFEKQMWEDLWLDIKEHWNIQDNKPKDVLIKKAKKNCTNWRSKLVREFVRKNKHPFAKYDYLDQSKWDEFVAKKTSNAFLEKSHKAKSSAQKNKDFARTGRTGFRGLKEKFDNIWPQLVASYPYLENMQDKRSQKWVTSRAKLNKQTRLYEVEDIREKIHDLINFEIEMKEDGSYHEGRVDPISRYFGPEHGGRSRMVSCIIGSTQVHGGLYNGGRQQNQNDVPTTQTRSDERVNRGPGSAPGGSYIDYPDFQFVRSPEVNEVQQQMPSNLHIDTDDFVNSSFAMAEVSQILLSQIQDDQQQMQLHVQPPLVKITKELDQVKQAKRIKSAQNRPKRITNMVTRLQSHLGNDFARDPIMFPTPSEMFPVILHDYIEYEALLQLLTNGWVDITIISWFSTYFYKESNRLDNPCAFFGTHSITGDMCQRRPEEVQSHILNVYNIHSDKQYFLAPYLAGKHWSLFIISPTKKEVFILDSSKGQKDKNSYLLSKVIQDGFEEIEFTWTMVECKQQMHGWECGYMVLGFMFEFVYNYQKDFPNHVLQETVTATQEYIDDLLTRIMPVLLKSVF